MNQFEKEYYESDSFWAGEMVQDEYNLERFRITEQLIPPDVISIVDVGCGNGVFVNKLLQGTRKLKIHAVDRSNKALEYVKTSKVRAEITSLPFEDSTFDCVTCLEVIEHLTIPDYRLALKELTRVSKKYVIISVPYNENLEANHTKCPSCKTIFNTDLHLRTFTDQNFATTLKDWGFNLVSQNKIGLFKNYKFHSLYKRIFYPEQVLMWTSPICPICGYSEEKDTKMNPVSQIKYPKRKLISYFSQVPKLMWPKDKKYFWILGLFEKK